MRRSTNRAVALSLVLRDAREAMEIRAGTGIRPDPAQVCCGDWFWGITTRRSLLC